MSATLLSQSGIFSAAVYERILRQLSAISHQASAFDCEETVYERGAVDNGLDENLLRLRTMRRNAPPHRHVSMLVLQKPESARLQPTVLCRTVLTTEFASTEQDPSRLISALGYRRKFSLFTRGVEFVRGTVTIQIYRLYLDATIPTPLDDSYLITVFCSVPDPVRPKSIVPALLPGKTEGVIGTLSTQELKLEAMERIRQVRETLKGLVDLSRAE